MIKEKLEEINETLKNIDKTIQDRDELMRNKSSGSVDIPREFDWREKWILKELLQYVLEFLLL